MFFLFLTQPKTITMKSISTNRKIFFLLIAIVCVFTNNTNAQVNQWTWTNGSGAANQQGAYGTQGTPSAGNLPGGREGAVKWIDANGNTWLFGGFGISSTTSGRLNDLWKFDKGSQLWTWMSGANTPNQTGVYGTKHVANAMNIPGARNGASGWYKNGELWMMGGEGYGQMLLGNLNDLWKYTISTGVWTWEGGSITSNQDGNYGTQGSASTSNQPGARTGATAWCDPQGNFILMGGYGQSSNGLGLLNDLWSFNPILGNWTWVKGSNEEDEHGNYGISGGLTLNLTPGARYGANSWTDLSGNLWLFGGYGYGISTIGWLNDLWKFDINTNEWISINGSVSPNQQGTYGIQGQAHPTNKPGGRYGSLSWSDAADQLWIFAGSGFDGSGNAGFLNDMWKYDIVSGLWTWMSGSKVADEFGVYGTQGTSSASNSPGARYGAIIWTDNNGKVFMMGGRGNGSIAESRLNDVWSFTQCVAPPTPTGDAQQTFCDGATIAQLSAIGNNIRWYQNPLGGNQLAQSVQLTDMHHYYAAQRDDACFSDVRLEVISKVNPTHDITTAQTACDSYTWDGITYTASGLYSHSYLNEYTCDSIHRKNVEIKQSTSASVSVTSEGCFAWNINNVAYPHSGIYTATIANAVGCDSVITLNLTVTPRISLTLKALLQGPYNSSTELMNDALRTNNLVPFNEPYSSPPYNKPIIGEPGGETVSQEVLNLTGENAIVDWVYVEIRNASNSSQLVATKCALIQRDGDVVNAIDGTSKILFTTVTEGNYYVSIKHRNHLAVMTSAPISLSHCGANAIDFSVDPVYIKPSINNLPRKQINNKYLLWSGDANSNKNVKYNGLSNDKDVILNTVGVGTFNNIVPGYRAEDINMDGVVKYNNADNDKNLILNNVGIIIPNVVLNQHTPN